ncbi:arf-GAP with Rho-GAP domain, ANK repeat and PH domain-containing protein 1-like [Protobothrops mucrosquamatus]|uniref:arf-GAP with Rho-GAP domain, ANK repeat and PH domain-containing protein 1-like n=1 Tax=Protobothrops mucrosquamatus TaxID=103944 RepID=UPI000775CDBF|nr:arf-GAP with Rho-GAP domain, ANK repeat and PH domain-containing protein 1-like [Protobothrops mucrosquamatus]
MADGPSLALAEWLQKLRLDQYVETFEQNQLRCLQDCQHLTDEGLTRLGVLLPGHRKRILSGLSKFFAELPSSAGRPQLPPRRPVPKKRHIFRTAGSLPDQEARRDLAGPSGKESPPEQGSEASVGLLLIPPPIPPRTKDSDYEDPPFEEERETFMEEMTDKKATPERRRSARFNSLFSEDELVEDYFKEESDVYSKRFILVASISQVSSIGDQKFEVITNNRTFAFRAESDAERNEWIQAVQKMVDEKKSRCLHRPSRLQPAGSSLDSVDRSGPLELRGFKSKLYVAVAGEKVFLYKNAEEFRLGIGITYIEMNVGNVKDVDRRCFDLTTPYRIFSFMAESDQEKELWVEAMQQSVAEALSNFEVAEKIWTLKDNCLCADCGAPKPDWGSINLCVVICKRCAGEHRGLGPSVTKVRSLKMDKKVWTEELIELFLQIGNAVANQFWAANVPPSEMIAPESHSQQRRHFLIAKYREGKYRRYHPLFGNQDELNKALCTAVTTSDLAESLSLLFCGAEANCYTGDPDYPTPVALAEQAGQRLQMEFLMQNKTSETPQLDAGPQAEQCYSVISLSVAHNGFLYKAPSMAKLALERKSREGGRGKGWGVFLHHAQASLPPAAEGLLGRDFERLGRLRYKGGLSLERAQEGWFALVGSSLYAFLEGSGREELIQLRKLQELSLENDVLVLVERRRIPYGESLRLTSEGIYRKSGQNSKITSLLESLRRDARKVRLKEEDHQLDDVANTLKRFFRDLEDGLFTKDSAQAWLKVPALEDLAERISRYRRLLNSLPVVNKATMKALINHLYRIQCFSDENQMTTHNLAIVFGPTLFQTDGKDFKAGQVVEDLIRCYMEIFSVGWAKDDGPAGIAGDFICTVYLEEKKMEAEQHVKVGDSKHGLMKFREEKNVLGLGLSTGFHDRYFILNNHSLRLYKEVRDVFGPVSLDCRTQVQAVEGHGGNVWPSESSKIRTPQTQPDSRLGNVSLIPLRGSENEMRNSVAALVADPLTLLRDV